VSASAAATLAAGRATQRGSAQSSVESCAVNLHKVPVAAFGAGDCSKICLSSICSVAERGDGKRRLLLHSNLALINFVFAYKFFIFLCPCIWICQGQLMPVLQQLALMIAP